MKYNLKASLLKARFFKANEKTTSHLCLLIGLILVKSKCSHTFGTRGGFAVKSDPHATPTPRQRMASMWLPP